MKLTEREKDLLVYVTKFKQVNGYAPTIREIAKGINSNSINHIKEMLSDLKKKGYINYKDKSPRTIVVLRSI